MRRYGLYFVWLISCIATLASLYISDILHIDPCHLCWYQRIAIFPLVIIVGIAAFRGFTGIVPYVLPLTLLGLAIAGYQIAIQEIPGWEPIHLCGAGPSCSEKYDIGLGPITIPMLSAGTLALISVLLACTWGSETWHRWRDRS